MKPFLKWAGGKYRLIERIREHLPHAQRLIEPFAGSGAVFLNCDYSNNLIADSNPHLIYLYQILQNKGDKYINDAKVLFSQENNTKEKFIEFRQKFNESDDIYEKSLLFLYLNRHCFNGLCRFNNKGGFNVPFGRYNKPYFPQKELEFFINKSKQATFIHSDFKNTFQQAQFGDVIYCDPPYVPLTQTASFTSYTKDNFTAQDQVDLSFFAKRASEKGIHVLLSNHSNLFSRNLYKDAKIIEFDVQRFISSDYKNRNPARELLAAFQAHDIISNRKAA